MPARSATVRRLMLAAAPLALLAAAVAPVPTIVMGDVEPNTSQRVISYPLEHVWPASIRHLRVDRSFSLTDRDKDAGFILFEIPGEPVASGSVELVATTDDSGRAGVRVTVRLANAPSYMPHAIAEGIAGKVKAERGPPPAPPSAPPEGSKPPAEEDPHGLPMLPPAIDP